MSDVLKLLVRSGNTLISIETTDEDRAVRLVRRLAIEMSRPMFEWSMTTGLRPVENDVPREAVVPGGKVNPSLSHISERPGRRTIYLFKDLGPHTKDARVHRTLRDLLE